jgi:hypothetical protein
MVVLCKGLTRLGLWPMRARCGSSERAARKTIKWTRDAGTISADRSAVALSNEAPQRATGAAVERNRIVECAQRSPGRSRPHQPSAFQNRHAIGLAVPDSSCRLSPDSCCARCTHAGAPRNSWPVRVSKIAFHEKAGRSQVSSLFIFPRKGCSLRMCSRQATHESRNEKWDFARHAPGRAIHGVSTFADIACVSRED